jgi:hypothetical protein
MVDVLAEPPRAVAERVDVADEADVVAADCRKPSWKLRPTTPAQMASDCSANS